MGLVGAAEASPMVQVAVVRRYLQQPGPVAAAAREPSLRG